MILRDIARENLLVIIVRSGGRVISVVVMVGVMVVFEHHSYRLDLGMPGRRAPSHGKQDGENCAETRHQYDRGIEMSPRCKGGLDTGVQNRGQICRVPAA